ncbi:MAG: DegT/DnrJ/EryC1/StrS family aminotransferase [Desulforudis sp.]|nr:MAG: DegT/DnrJ/EryC1/StrS family aminotransferase [Desulforudis sp.]
MGKLAINGGRPIRDKDIPEPNPISGADAQAALRVLERGLLSGYRGNWVAEFYGGPEVQALEQTWAGKIGVRHVLALNSATSGLIVACGAIGLSPGDEVIVSPWSMTCSATAPLIWGATPVFADIEPDCFCLDPKAIEKKITPRTKAILVVDLFGQPHDWPAVRALAEQYGLYVIEDAAQAVGSFWSPPPEDGQVRNLKNYYAGALGDIGVFSFNQGKHLTCGEGGLLATNDTKLALRCRLLANHAEAVYNGMDDAAQWPGDPFLVGLVGYNLRMTEIQAAIIGSQLERITELIYQRTENVRRIERALAGLPAIELTNVREWCRHTFYVQAMKWRAEEADGLHRDRFIAAVKAELGGGRSLSCGYIKPIYLMPLFRACEHPALKGKEDFYQEGLCPTAEWLWRDKLFLHRLIAPGIKKSEIDDLTNAFIKAWENRRELR